MRETEQHSKLGDWVDTSAGGENEEGSLGAGRTPGSGANDITRAGLPNADPDGYDVERSDLEGIDVGDAPPSKRGRGA
jgi:hypothetical protein